MPRIEIREPNTSTEKQAGIRCRWYYLRKPLGLHLSSATDEFEDQAYHLIACLQTRPGQMLVVGTGRLHINQDKQAQIRYLAVAKSNRHQGIGRQLVRALEKQAQRLNYQQVIANVRSKALPFYQSLGYRIIDGPFDQLHGTQHYHMKNDKLESS